MNTHTEIQKIRLEIFSFTIIQVLADNVIIESNDEEKTKIDWQKLKSINRDIIGWIKIENTNINYPILQDNDELKYLRHSFNKEYNKNGSIFTLNNRPFEDKKTVLYGHNMKNETMFFRIRQIY